MSVQPLQPRPPHLPRPFLFPAALRPTALAVLRELDIAPTDAGPRCELLSIGGEPLTLPCRIYSPLSRLQTVVDNASGDARTFASCLATRHWDGHEREAYLRRLLDRVEHPWVVPFVVQLLGEYVVEIAQVIEAGVPGFDPLLFGAFARANAAYMATTRRRAVSDWDCYYRTRYRSLADYPAWRALTAIEDMARTTAQTQSEGAACAGRP